LREKSRNEMFIGDVEIQSLTELEDKTTAREMITMVCPCKAHGWKDSKEGIRITNLNGRETWVDSERDGSSRY
jgi:hypothetical protein